MNDDIELIKQLMEEEEREKRELQQLQEKKQQFKDSKMSLKSKETLNFWRENFLNKK